MTVDDAGLTRFNALPDEESAEALRSCCAAAEWVDRLVGGRPYASRVALLETAGKMLDALDWAGVREALDAHPRIGERVAGSGREAAWSRGEQSGMDVASEQTKAALVGANRAYEERFGHVFLIFATGRTDTEMLAAAVQRLQNDDETEQRVVRGELARIVRLRLTKLLGEEVR